MSEDGRDHGPEAVVSQCDDRAMQLFEFATAATAVLAALLLALTR